MKEGIVVFSPKEEDVYDWSGHQLSPEIRGHIGPGNCVRIQVHDEVNGALEAIYVDITEIDEQDLLRGIVLDNHRMEKEDGIGGVRLEGGDIISFARRCVIEIPHQWEGNEDLHDLVEQGRTGSARSITGVLGRSGEP